MVKNAARLCALLGRAIQYNKNGNEPGQDDGTDG